jgi:hypothetical protein
MADSTSPAPRRAAQFPVWPALVWALTLTAACAWSLYPEHRHPAEGWAFFGSPETAAPTDTFLVLAKVTTVFFAAVWPMFLLSRGHWIPRGTAKPVPAPSRPPAAARAVRSTATAAFEGRQEGSEVSLERDLGVNLPPPRPRDELPAGENQPIELARDDEPIPLEPKPVGRTAVINQPEGSPAPRPPDSEVERLRAEDRPAGAAPSPLSDRLSTFSHRQAEAAADAPAPLTPEEARQAQAALRDLTGGAVVSLPPPPPPPPVTGSAGLRQLLVLAVIALPFWVAARILSDAPTLRVVEAALLPLSFAVLHVGYAAATAGWTRFAPDRFYIAALLLLTLGWFPLSEWALQFGLSGPWMTHASRLFNPPYLAEQIAGGGMAWTLAEGDAEGLPPMVAAAFWPAAAGGVLAVLSLLTGRRV